MWFEGAINQALDKSKNEKLMLMTFIQSKNENSIKMNNQLESEDFKIGVNDKFVSLKFDQDSKEGTMFKQIYNYDETPTLYLISSSALVYEKITGLVETSDLIKKVNAALDKQKSLREQACQTSDSTSLKRAANESPAKSEESKAIKAQELLKEIRVKKAKEEEQRDRDAEKERIRTGKELQTAREIQLAKEMAELVKQREREKLEEKRHREKVLNEIKQDQEDRKARQAGQFEVKKPLIISQPTKIESDQTRIQFRLPDSTVLKNVFNINDTLRIVYKYIEDNSEYRSFKLCTNFPVKEFDDVDLDKTLVDLKLIPSCWLIVKKPQIQQNVGL